MDHRERKLTWIWIGCAAVLSILLVFLVDRLAEKEPEIILWSDLRYGDPKNLDESIRQIRITEGALKETMIPEIDFRDEPFLDCLDSLEKAMNENRTGSDTFRIVLEESVGEVNVPIRLRLTDVPAAEGMMYLTSLAGLKYRVSNDGDVEIVELSDEGALEEGWFEPDLFFFHDINSTEEKIDVREIMERAGVHFSDGAVAEYYPKSGLFWARNTRNQLEFIDMLLAPQRCYPELTWQDHIYYYWWVLTNSYPPKPVSTPPTRDPFGKGASTSSVEPDPFGGGGTPSPSGPDPFKRRQVFSIREMLHFAACGDSGRRLEARHSLWGRDMLVDRLKTTFPTPLGSGMERARYEFPFPFFPPA